MAAVLALLVAPAPVAAATLTYDTRVKTNQDWAQEFTVSTGGTITATASFNATNGVYYFELDRLYPETGEWLTAAAKPLDARWGRASGPQTITLTATNQIADQYRVRFYAGRTTDLYVVVEIP